MDYKLWKKEMLHWITLNPKIVNGNIVFTKNGKMHNIDFPARIQKFTENDNNGTQVILWYYEEGVMKRNDNLPTVVRYDTHNETYKKLYEQRSFNDKPYISRDIEDIPYIRYYYLKSGHPREDVYCLDNSKICRVIYKPGRKYRKINKHPKSDTFSFRTRIEGFRDLSPKEKELFYAKLPITCDIPKNNIENNIENNLENNLENNIKDNIKDNMGNNTSKSGINVGVLVGVGIVAAALYYEIIQ